MIAPELQVRNTVSGALSQKHTCLKTVSSKGTDCNSTRMDHKDAGKVSFVPLVSGCPSGLSTMNYIPCSRKTAGGGEESDDMSL